MNLQLTDKRTKTETEKRVTKNYRLKPEVVNHLKQLAKRQGATETEVLEELISRAR